MEVNFTPFSSVVWNSTSAIYRTISTFYLLPANSYKTRLSPCHMDKCSGLLFSELDTCLLSNTSSARLHQPIFGWVTEQLASLQLSFRPHKSRTTLSISPIRNGPWPMLFPKPPLALHVEHLLTIKTVPEKVLMIQQDWGLLTYTMPLLNGHHTLPWT